MSSLSMVEAKLPPGFRFHPRDDELVCDYLLKKWNSCESSLLTQVDLNKCEPWDIPEKACIGGKEWYFYSQRDRKYATGQRTNRATVSGYWKATGKDRAVLRRGSLVGMRKTLVFYQGRAPKGTKTQWVMHEFRVEGPFGPPKLTSPSKEDWVLCRVFFKKKDGPTRSGTEDDSNNNSIEETTTTTSSSLMDSYIRFDQQTPANNTTTTDHANYQQVPCFSIFAANQDNNNPTNLLYPHQNYPMDTTNPTKNNHHHETNPTNMGGSRPVTCEKKVLEAVLSQLTKMETCPHPLNGSSSLGEAASSESYLSEVGLQQPTMWTHY